MPIYLDSAGGAPWHPAAREAATKALAAFGDPSSAHAPGREARAIIERAREQVAAAIGAEPDEIVFTGGAPQANALAIAGVVGRSSTSEPNGGRIVTTMLEHPSVTAAAASTGREVVQVPCDEYGRADTDAAAALLPGAAMAAIQHANQDVGTINPVAECASLARAHGARLHTDASQTAAVLPVDARALGVDLMTIAGGPAGAGRGIAALFVRRGLSPDPFLHAGGSHRQAPMEANLVGAAALGAALQALAPEIPDLAARLWTLSGRLRDGLAAASADLRMLGHPTQRLPHIVSWAVEGIDAETLLMSLEDRGIVAGTASTSALVRAGLARPGDAVVRMSVSRDTTENDVSTVIDAVPSIVGGLRAMAVRADAAFARFED
ncbi:MAG TPA: aminotransferase class V-fold PLP-dependent enzyme [Actinomycetota bacterium]|jgi:cysteine desulfurase